MSVTTLEVWGNVVLSDAQRETIDTFLIEQRTAGKMANSLGTFGNFTTEDGNTFTANVSFTFADTDTANAYLSFISNLNPQSATIVS